MPDLFSVQDGKYLKDKWDHLYTVFHIVSRDYKRVLAGEFEPGHFLHIQILKQLVSDLIDVEADLKRVGQPSPTEAFIGWKREAWTTAVVWVHEFRAWQIPPDGTSDGEFHHALIRRQLAEDRFSGVVLRVPDTFPQNETPTDSPTVLVHAA